ncbi:hypothetical protein GCM10010532_066040 [Dactylosporangium siamense]|uniref:Uncharacterized protein n=1 Tax=Dactylosporangium siamense TaxID=685454 RepID=A0A919U8L5_9ACTN|nr:hypothetical protein Dsi01nite_047300 [Dactylosporangium siamense]
MRYETRGMTQARAKAPTQESTGGRRGADLEGGTFASVLTTVVKWISTEENRRSRVADRFDVRARVYWDATQVGIFGLPWRINPRSSGTDQRKQ